MRIAARGLVVRFGERAALAGLDCDLVSGELTGLIGPNGAGKTTLLKVLAGLLRADAGETRYDGVSAAELGRAALARRVAYLAQSGLSHWPLSVDHVVALGRLPHRRPFSPPSAADRAAVEAANALYKKHSLGARDDAGAMQFLIPGWTFDDKRPSLVRQRQITRSNRRRSKAGGGP